MTRKEKNYKGGNNMLNHGLLFQVYGEGAAWQFLGWILVFACLVLANEIARRTKVGGMFRCSSNHSDSLLYCNLRFSSSGS